MGWAWETANVRKFGMPEVWDYPPHSPRHRKPRPQRMQAAAALAHAAVAAARTAPRLAKGVGVTGPPRADHRRPFEPAREAALRGPGQPPSVRPGPVPL